MSKISKKKLTLKAETLRTLSGTELDATGGNVMQPTSTVISSAPRSFVGACLPDPNPKPGSMLACVPSQRLFVCPDLTVIQNGAKR